MVRCTPSQLHILSASFIFYQLLVENRRRQWHPTLVLLPGKSHGWRSLVGCNHGVAKSWARLSDFPFTFHFPALEKEMAPHSSALAWRIPGPGEPGGLPPLGSHGVGHACSDSAAAAENQPCVHCEPLYTGAVPQPPLCLWPPTPLFLLEPSHIYHGSVGS